MVSCGGGGSSGGGGGSKNDNTTLTSISIEKGEQDVATTTNARNDVLASITDPELINLKKAAEGVDVEVTLNYPALFKGVAKLVKIASDGTITVADFDGEDAIEYKVTAKPAYTFEEGDKLYVQMTSQDGKKVRYYAYTVTIGKSAALEDFILVDGATQYKAYSMGNSYPALESTVWGQQVWNLTPANSGRVQVLSFNESGYLVKPLVWDEDATVEISVDASDDSWTTVSSTEKVVFEENDNRYVKVTSPDGSKTLYYRFYIVLLRTVNIPYATPEKIDANDIDDTWWNNTANATAWLPIDRVNLNETQAILEFDEDIQTFGRAKLAWDAEGVYVYAQVWEVNVTEMEESGNSNHTVSSVELFINESNGRTGTVAASPNENGGQYRLGANNVRSGPQANQTAAFNALDKSSAKKYTGNMISPPEDKEDTAITNGYVVIFQAPWLYPDLYEIKDNKELTIELQINAIDPTDPDGGRVGVLNWNNATGNSYNSVEGYGKATLKTNGKTIGAMGAQITTQPRSGRVALNAAIPALSVDATSPDKGSLTYQWYSADSANGTGTAITGAISKTYTPSATAFPTSAKTKYYFYAVVTNTKGGGSTNRKSAVATITVYDPEEVIPSVELLDSPITGTLVGGYGTQCNVPFAVDLAEYGWVEIWYSIAGGAPVTNLNDCDFFIEIYGTGGKVQVPDSEGGYQGGGTNYNADGILLNDDDSFGGTSYKLTPSRQAATGGDGAKIEIKHKGTAGAQLTITSVKLVPKED